MSGRFARSARNVAAAGAAALLLLGLAVWGLARSGAVDAWLTARIAVLAGPQLRFSAAHAVWWPRLAVVLDRVVLVPAGGAPEAGAADAAAVRCELRLRPLLSGHVEIGAVRIDGLHVAVEQGADGTIHACGLETLAVRAASAGSTGGPARIVPAVEAHDAALEYRAAGDVPRELHLSALDLRLAPDGTGARVELAARVDGGGSVQVRGAIDSLASLGAARYTATIDADQLDAAAAPAWLPALAGSASAQGHLRLAATLAGQGETAIEADASIELSDGALTRSGWQVGTPLRLAAHAVWDGSALTLSHGRLEAARLTGGPLLAETLAATFSYAAGALRVDAVQLRACGGTWHAGGGAILSDPPQVDGSLQAEGVDGSQLVEAVRAFGAAGPLPRLDATLRLSAQATGLPGGAWSGRASIETDGAVAMPPLRAAGPLRLTADVQVIGTRLAHASGHVEAPRVAIGRLALDAIGGDFTYADGSVRAAPLRAQVCGGTWTYSGTLPLDAAAAWSGEVAATGVSAAELRGALGDRDGSAATATDGVIDLSARLAGTGAAARGTAAIRLASDALTWDALRIERPAEVSGAVQTDGTRLTLSDGQATARSVRTGDLTASDVRAGFAYANDTVRLAALRAHAFGGSWRVSGVAALAGTPTWTAAANARHVDFGALLDAAAHADAGSPRSDGGVADLAVNVARAADGSARGTATVDLRAGAFIWQDLRVDAPARAVAEFTARGGNFTVAKATAEATRAAYGPLVGTAAKGRFHYDGERLSFEDLRFRSCGGVWTHSGWFTLGGGGSFAGLLNIEGATVHELAAMLSDEAFEVPFKRVDLDSDFRGSAGADWVSELEANGSIFLSDGTVPSATVLRPIWEALVGPGRVLQALDRSTNHVEEFSDTFALQRGRFNTTDLSVSSTDYHIAANGSIGLDGSLDLAARIQLTAQGVQKMLVLGSLPLPTASLPGLPPIPAIITGSLADPVVRPNVSALPASTAQWLAQAALHAPRAVAGAAIHRLGELWNGVKRVAGAGDKPVSPTSP
jgi:uncharacterized protein involved in outer membrane biogenesis